VNKVLERSNKEDEGRKNKSVIDWLSYPRRYLPFCALLSTQDYQGTTRFHSKLSSKRSYITGGSNLANLLFLCLNLVDITERTSRHCLLNIPARFRIPVTPGSLPFILIPVVLDESILTPTLSQLCIKVYVFYVIGLSRH
jgi:hypothetical protein